MKCAKCGAELKKGCLYCSVCGHEAQIVSDYNVLEDDYLRSLLKDGEGEKNPQEKEPEPKKTKKKKQARSRFRHTKRTDITKKTALKKNLKMQAILLLKSEKKKKSPSIIFRLFSC